jgi:hypothetical protein
MSLVPTWAALLCLAFASPAQAAPVVYSVSIDTAAFSGQTGFLDLQLNPGGPAAQSMTATVSNLAAGTGGSFPAAPPVQLDGAASGSVASGFSISNTDPFNAALVPVEFGSVLSFLVQLSGDAIDNPDPGSLVGTTFSFGVLGDNLTPLLEAPGSFGEAGSIDIPGGGSPQIGPLADGVNVTAVIPEPASLALFGSAALAVVAWRRRKPTATN